MMGIPVASINRCGKKVVNYSSMVMARSTAPESVSVGHEIMDKLANVSRSFTLDW